MASVCAVVGGTARALVVRMLPIDDRIAIAINHAETLADEAIDIGLYAVSDRLRAHSSRLAVERDILEAAQTLVSRTRSERAHAYAQLRARNEQFETEVSMRFEPDEAAIFLAVSRVPPDVIAGFRLRRLTSRQRKKLGSAVTALQAALTVMAEHDDEHLAAVAKEVVAKSICIARANQLRAEAQKAKLELLAALPQTSAAAKRIRRRVVRTRRPDNPWCPPEISSL